AERGARRSPREPGGDDVGRGHQPVAVLVMLVDADAVEAERVRVLELIHVLVVHGVALARVVERVRDVDPDRTVLLPEIVRQVRPRTEVEPGEFHASPRVGSTPDQSEPSSGFAPTRSSAGFAGATYSWGEVRKGGKAPLRATQRPDHCGFLFSTNALAPSTRSSVVRSSVERSFSRRRPSASHLPSPP